MLQARMPWLSTALIVWICTQEQQSHIEDEESFKQHIQHLFRAFSSICTLRRPPGHVRTCVLDDMDDAPMGHLAELRTHPETLALLNPLLGP